MSLGGSIQHVLMPYHYRTVVVKGPRDGDWLGAIMTSLSRYGEIEKEYSKIGKQNRCLLVTFYNPDDAVNAVRSLESPEGIFIEPHLQHNSGEVGAMFTLKIEWCDDSVRTLPLLTLTTQKIWRLPGETYFIILW